MDGERAAVQQARDQEFFGVDVHGQIPRLALSDPQPTNDVTGKNLYKTKTFI